MQADKVMPRIVAALKAKTGDRQFPCFLCGREHWTIQAGYLVLPLSEAPQRTVMAGPCLPCVALMCQHCGQTVLLNLKLLGFKEADMAALDLTAAPQP